MTQRDILTLPSLVVTLRTTTYSTENAAFWKVIVRCIARDFENEELVFPLRALNSSFAINKYLHTVASGWIFFT